MNREYPSSCLNSCRDSAGCSKEVSNPADFTLYNFQGTKFYSVCVAHLLVYIKLAVLITCFERFFFFTVKSSLLVCLNFCMLHKHCFPTFFFLSFELEI